MILTGAAVVAAAVHAKTVALWPLEAESGNIGLHCVINPANDFSKVGANFVNTDTDVEWELPPNPDSGRHALLPVNRTAVHEKYAGGSRGFLYNRHSARYLRRDKAFTVEGYMKVLELPASNKWACVLCAYAETASGGLDNNRWTFSLRRRSNEAYACSWILWGNGGGDAVLYRYADEEASYAITNTWIHIALTHEPFGTNGKDHWKLFLNGVQAGESDYTGSVIDSYTSHRFDLGARSDGDNHINAVFDYWRISDKALEPSEFLCAGEGGTTVTASHTVAYWPLGVTETGGIDCRDAVGTSPLTGGFYGAKFTANCMTPVEDCAFAGNPPNSTVTLPDGNAGSFLGSATASCLQNDAVGGALNVASNFTVEGWFCPRICERETKTANGEAVCMLFGTRPDYSSGWTLQYRARGIDNAQFDVYGQDESGTVINSVKLSGSFDVSGWYGEWRHLALTYDATGGANGYGLWSLFIDGVQVGSAENSRMPVAITESRPFTLGGRASVANQSFQGKMDCVRVSATVLSHSQFLNATAGTDAATEVVALWPLNVINGVFPDLRDVSGKGNHFAVLDNYPDSLVMPDPDNKPVISNPDSTPTFRGDPSKVNGSARFRNPDAIIDNHKANLITDSEALMKTFAAGDFTYEFYYMRRSSSKDVTGDQETFFMPANSSNSAHVRFFRTGDGFYIWENLYTSSTLEDTCLLSNNAGSGLKYDEWQHLALVHSIETVDGVAKSVWRLYLDGELKGTASQDAKAGAVTAPKRLFVGGRYSNGRNAVVGNLSSVRLSDCALVPGEFLCATPMAGETPEPTIGYWPIDSEAPGLANLVDEEYPLSADGSAVVQSGYARPSIPNRGVLTNLVGAARKNHGSCALGAAGKLVADSIGFEMAGPRQFTVEGWLAWSPFEGVADEDLVTVGDAQSANGGLRIYFDKSGASPKLRVFARGAWPCTPYVDGAFDADFSPYLGNWVHLAVAYDANDGEGTWTLYVEGKQVGNKVMNLYRPTPVDYSRGGEFQIGSTVHPLSAAVDMWRVSTLAYEDPDDFLYAPLMGFLLFYK